MIILIDHNLVVLDDGPFVLFRGGNDIIHD